MMNWVMEEQKKEVEHLAEKVQDKFGSSDAEDTYHALLNPLACTRQEQIKYGKQSVSTQETDDVLKTQDLFEEDFFFWNEKHFNPLPKSVITKSSEQGNSKFGSSSKDVQVLEEVPLFLIMS